MYFYPRSPCGERPGPKSITPDRYYFYPRSPCGERQPTAGILRFYPLISIHALLAESDRRRQNIPNQNHNFYPRSPCGERRNQSIISQANRNFYPRSPCGERRRRGVLCYLDNIISIHALLAESDAAIANAVLIASDFYPRSPCGERQIVAGLRSHTPNFYPRSPCGERRHAPRPCGSTTPIFLSTLSLRRATVYALKLARPMLFLSTLSLRRATVHYDNYNLHCVISIHALLAESDANWFDLWGWAEYFYPRSPCGERQTIMNNIVLVPGFLSTLSLRRATAHCPLS